MNWGAVQVANPVANGLQAEGRWGNDGFVLLQYDNVGDLGYGVDATEIKHHANRRVVALAARIAMMQIKLAALEAV